MVSKAEAQRRYREERTVSAGPDTDTRRRRDAALRREREKKRLSATGVLRRYTHAQQTPTYHGDGRGDEYTPVQPGLTPLEEMPSWRRTPRGRRESLPSLMHAHTHCFYQQIATRVHVDGARRPPRRR